MLHAPPPHPKSSLPKFDPVEGIYVDNHLQSFFLALEVLVVEHEDAVYRLFPHTLKAKASSWYLGLQENSITDWDTFERLFKSKFGHQRTTSTLMKELLSLRMDKKDKVQDFIQRFAAHLNNISVVIKPTKETLMEYFTSTLSPDITMFVKRSVKPYLIENYEEAKKVKDELESINKQTTEPNTKTFSSKKPLLLTKPKEERSNELEKSIQSYPTRLLI